MNKRIFKLIPIILVMNFSFYLLLYVGYGEAQRTYWKFKLDKLKTQSLIVCDLMDDFLKIGLPLTLIRDFLEKRTPSGKFAGFNVFQSSSGSDNHADIEIAVLDVDGNVVFSNVDHPLQESITTNKRQADQNQKQGVNKKDETPQNENLIIEEDDYTYHMVTPLRDKFNQVGSLIVTISKKPVQTFLKSKFSIAFYITLAVSLGMSILSISSHFFRIEKKKKFYLGVCYTSSCLIIATATIATLMTIYTYGAEDKIKALSYSLSQRLSAVVESGVDFATIDGLSNIINEYKLSDSEIESVAFIENDIVSVHQESKKIGHPWQSDSNQKAFFQPISGSNAVIAVTIDKVTLRNKILVAVKNLITLIVACFFIGFLTFKIGSRLQSNPEENESVLHCNNSSFYSQSLYETIMPVWFTIVFAEALSLSFLPNYLGGLCQAQQISSALADFLFSTFFVGFALILVPSGYLADKWNEKNLILMGIVFFSISMVLMGITTYLPALLAVRLLAGAAQGIVFIGVQKYIQKVCSKGNVTQGGAVIVFSFNGGIISGSAIGAILLADIGTQGIFFSSAAFAALAFLFTLFYLPFSKEDRKAVQHSAMNHSINSTWEKTKALIGDGDFLRTLVLIGMTSKAIYTGITIYAVPLLMTRLNYSSEDIGLALMLYAGAVLFSNHHISKWVDKTGQIPFALFSGILTSSIGIIFISLIQWQPILDAIPNAPALLFFGGMVLLGIANGAVSSPVVSHIMMTRTCTILGQGSAVAVYRLLERLGHIAGPIIVGPLLIQGNQKTNAILLLGVIVGAFAGFFFYTNYRTRHRFNQKVMVRVVDKNVLKK